METEVSPGTREAISKIAEKATTRYCPLAAGIDDPRCIKEDCAWFVRNGCAIFHIACAAIEAEKMLRDKRRER